MTVDELLGVAELDSVIEMKLRLRAEVAILLLERKAKVIIAVAIDVKLGAVGRGILETIGLESGDLLADGHLAADGPGHLVFTSVRRFDGSIIPKIFAPEQFEV